MVDISTQRRVAAEILKCGVNRVWIDPNRIEDVAEAVTRADLRVLIKDGAIRAHQKRGVSRARARARERQRKKGKRRGHGSRKGTKYARYPKKRQWIDTIRPIRSRLRELRDAGKIDRRTYRKFYRYAKGGMFKSKGHMEAHLKLKKH